MTDYLSVPLEYPIKQQTDFNVDDPPLSDLIRLVGENSICKGCCMIYYVHVCIDIEHSLSYANAIMVGCYSHNVATDLLCCSDPISLCPRIILV
jgi:hypothetical protein